MQKCDSHAHHHHSSTKVLFFAVFVTFVFALVEAAAGWLANSLALIGDAGHMATDATALALAAFAAWIAKKPPSKRFSYGPGRVEVLAALVNALLMLAIVGGIVVVAMQRFSAPLQVEGKMVMVVALIGLLVNILVFRILHHGEQTLNTRAARLHVLGDLLGSLAALIAGVVIYLTGWTLIDPLLSLLICLLIVVSSLKLLKEGFNVLMEAVPHHLDLVEVGRNLASTDNVRSVHDLHIWTLSSGKVALSAHIVLNRMEQWDVVLERLQTKLASEYKIEHVTLQPELEGQLYYPVFYARPPNDKVEF